jgi:hypothetical protein
MDAESGTHFKFLSPMRYVTMAMCLDTVAISSEFPQSDTEFLFEQALKRSCRSSFATSEYLQQVCVQENGVASRRPATRVNFLGLCLGQTIGRNNPIVSVGTPCYCRVVKTVLRRPRPRISGRNNSHPSFRLRLTLRRWNAARTAQARRPCHRCLSKRQSRNFLVALYGIWRM